SSDKLAMLPDPVTFSDTVFSQMNLTAMALVIVVLPAFMYVMGKRSDKTSVLPELATEKTELDQHPSGAEKLDHSRIFSLFFGLMILLYTLSVAADIFPQKGFAFINPNFINLLLLGLCLVLHRNFHYFLKAVDRAIGGASGILIQFPLYFGIMGVMNSSGLVQQFSDFFVNISTETTFPVFTFISAGIVNIFVPSGGGQWGVQGSIILQAALDLGVSIPKSIMALAYGDQLTNMLQPFWALPLLGITGLKAKEILPYTVMLMGVGTVIYVAVLLIF
ncbi:MAG: short-chain fatty acid transporter, partial [Flavobacteriales bacterium]|nr:short-chain fatty acid transporter [Flavobacteriales bacterium]